MEHEKITESHMLIGIIAISFFVVGTCFGIVAKTPIYRGLNSIGIFLVEITESEL